jgi:hypothetical protein
MSTAAGRCNQHCRGSVQGAAVGRCDVHRRGSSDRFLTAWPMTFELAERGVLLHPIREERIAAGARVRRDVVDRVADVLQVTITAGGSSVTVATVAAGQNAILTFSGTAKQRISVRTTSGRQASGPTGWRSNSTRMCGRGISADVPASQYMRLRAARSRQMKRWDGREVVMLAPAG